MGFTRSRARRGCWSGRRRRMRAGRFWNCSLGGWRRLVRARGGGLRILPRRRRRRRHPRRRRRFLSWWSFGSIDFVGHGGFLDGEGGGAAGLDPEPLGVIHEEFDLGHALG